MLDALIAGGLSQNDIAVAIGVSQPTIHRALRGRQIIYETGKAIERLYAEKCPSELRSPVGKILPLESVEVQGDSAAVQASSTGAAA